MKPTCRIIILLSTLFLNVATSYSTQFNRYPFAFVVKGSKAPQLLGKNLYRFCAFSFSKSTKQWTEIRIQVDEKNTRSEYVLSEGLPFTSNSDDSFFDQNDELVLWGPEFGDDFNLTQLSTMKSQLARTIKHAWKLHFNYENNLSYALMGECYSRNPQSPPSLAGFDAKTGSISTPTYSYNFKKDNAALLGEVNIKSKSNNIKLFQYSKFLMNFELPWYLPDFSLNHENFSSEIESWQVGPIRTIVAVGVKMTGLLSILNLHMFSELIFYENGLQIPSAIEFTFDPSEYFQLGTGIAYGIRFGDQNSTTIESNMPPLPSRTISKLTTDDTYRAKNYENFSSTIKSENVRTVVEVVVDESAKKDALAPMVFRKETLKDLAINKHWDWSNDLESDFGIFLDMSQVKKGSYDFHLDLKILPESLNDNVSVRKPKLSWQKQKASN